VREKAPCELETKPRRRASEHDEFESPGRVRFRLAKPRLPKRANANARERVAGLVHDASAYDGYACGVEDAFVDACLAWARTVVQEPDGICEGDSGRPVNPRGRARIDDWTALGLREWESAIFG
jgi:hypothetical protein